MKSTIILAFDQHAATTVAAVLLPGQRTSHTVDGTPGSGPYCRSAATAARALGGLDPAAPAAVSRHSPRRPPKRVTGPWRGQATVAPRHAHR